MNDPDPIRLSSQCAKWVADFVSADYCHLNSVTKNRTQNLPITQEIVKDFANAKVFSTLYLKSRYWLILFAQCGKPLTAFSTLDSSLYLQRVMSCGLKHTTGYFNDFISQAEYLKRVYEGVCKTSCLDDFMVYSNSWGEHDTYLSFIFEYLHIYEFQSDL